MIEKEALGLQAGSPKKRIRKWKPGMAFPILKSKELILGEPGVQG
jgi:hypothetical protein